MIRTVLTCILLVGCSTPATLYVHSQPQGAYLVERSTGTAWGTAPIALSYQPHILKAHRTADGCYLVNGFDARWVSGAKASLDTIKLCGSPHGTYNITFSRDVSLPGMDKDLQFALQVQALLAQQQQAAAAQTQALTSLFSTLSATPSVSPTVSCTSRQIRDTVHTECR